MHVISLESCNDELAAEDVDYRQARHVLATGVQACRANDAFVCLMSYGDSTTPLQLGVSSRGLWLDFLT